PVGATTPVPFNARIVVATHRGLEDLIEKGLFRGDLYARLAHFQLDVPSLADRREDVLLLCHHALGRDVLLEPALVDALLRYHWPYNGRELFAVAGGLSARGEDREVLGVALVAHRLRVDLSAQTTTSTTDSGVVAEEKAAPPTREEIERIIAEHKGNVR